MKKRDGEEIKKNKMPGRPPRAPENKMSRSVRSMVTPGVAEALEAVAAEHGITLSDAHRLALFEFLKANGKMDRTLLRDASWDSLRLLGII